MRIVGEWFLCNDGTVRPVMPATVVGANGNTYGDRFLVDSGSDNTVFSAAFLQKLQWPGSAAPQGLSLQGIGGSSAFVVVTTVLEFACDDGTPVHFRGQFAAFTNPAATDMSVLGRDVLNNFDVILSRRRDEVLLLTGNHRYQII